MTEKMRVKCIARVATQARREDGLIVTYRAGESDFFPLDENGNPPTNFILANNVTKDNVDFGKVAPAFLLEDTIPVEDLIEYMRKTYSEDLTGETRREVVRRLMHARSVMTSLPSDMSSIPMAHEFKSESSELDSTGLNLPEEPVKVSLEAMVEPAKEAEAVPDTEVAAALDDSDEAPESDALSSLLNT